MDHNSQSQKQDEISAETQDVRQAASVVRKRLQEHQRKIPAQQAEFPVIARRCAYLEAVMDDVENGRISGPAHVLAGLVATSRDLCDFLDTLDGKVLAEGAPKRQ